MGTRLNNALIAAELNRFYKFGLKPDETMDLDEGFIDEMLEAARFYNGNDRR